MKMSTDKIFALLFLLALMTGCGGDNEPTPEEKQRQLLTSGTWKIQSVTIGGADGMEFFSNFSVKFSESGFTTTNGGPVWPSSGTWKFTGSAASAIIRGDNLEVTILELTETSFRCRLQWDETIVDGGRSNAMAGEHIFVFVK